MKTDGRLRRPQLIAGVRRTSSALDPVSPVSEHLLVQARDLCVPIYLNQRIVFDLLAALQDGFSQISNLRETTEEKTAGSASAGLGLSNVFTFLGVRLGADAKKASESHVGTERQLEKVHTPASLFSVLRSELFERGLVKVFPEPEALEVIRNKSLQKTFYLNHGIPTSPFKTYDSKEELLNDALYFPCVWKSAEFGYDGKGVQILKSAEDLHKLPDTPCLIEEKVEFEYELAVIVARNEQGEVTTYPVVQMDFHPTANQVEYVVCPAAIPEHLAEKAKEIALRVATELQITGLLAVELFLNKEQHILVNEVAPRPHNSGHYSIEASYTNQFEQHLRAILGLPLGNTDSKAIGIMVNLVGADPYHGPVVYENINTVLAMKGVSVHIYGKTETRPFRKMGHVTVVDTDRASAYQKAKTVKESLIVKSHG